MEDAKQVQDKFMHEKYNVWNKTYTLDGLM